MNIRQIETFFWAARLGSFVQAARRLNATQSAVSMRIQEVEDHLGVKLFDRSQRRARLTPEGALLLPYAEGVLLAIDKLREAAAFDEHEAAGYARLGVTENVAVTWLGPFMARLKAHYPRIQIDLEIGVSYVLEEKLHSGALDMAFAACEMPPSKFHATRLQEIEFRWMCSPDLEAVPDVLTPESYTDLPILSMTREWQARGALLRWFTDNKIHFRNVTICNTFRTCASMAMEALGLAQLPVTLFRDELASGRLRTVRAEPELPPLEIWAISHAGSESVALKAIRSVAQAIAADY